MLVPKPLSALSQRLGGNLTHIQIYVLIHGRLVSCLPGIRMDTKRTSGSVSVEMDKRLQVGGGGKC